MTASDCYLYIDGVRYDADRLPLLRAKAATDACSYLLPLCDFLERWFDDTPFMTVHTSGSTGVPKEMTVRKQQMMNSARMTCAYLQLQEGDTALLCMDLRYIGAMMMVVRSLVVGMDLLVRPACGHPMSGICQPLTFAAMVPLQVYNTLQVAEEREQLKQTKQLIIGGGAIDEALETEIKLLPTAVYSTYGMTETLSHIALRRLNGDDASEHYHPFSSVRLSLSPEQTLMIDAPLVCNGLLQTNDIACIYPDGSFSILGRKDNVINSGGIKMQIEEIEKRLTTVIAVPFAITSVSDPRLGQAVTLLVEKTVSQEGLEQIVQSVLPPYYRPRYILLVEHIPCTGNGKISRVECRALAQRLVDGEQFLYKK